MLNKIANFVNLYNFSANLKLCVCVELFPCNENWSNLINVQQIQQIWSIFSVPMSIHEYTYIRDFQWIWSGDSHSSGEWSGYQHLSQVKTHTFCKPILSSYTRVPFALLLIKSWTNRISVSFTFIVWSEYL